MAAAPQKLIEPDASVALEAGPAAAAGVSDAPAPQSAVGKPRLITRRQFAQAVAAMKRVDAAAASSGQVSAQALTPALQPVLTAHNTYRALHSAPAMTWDNTAESGAAAYAARIWGHDANRGNFGENLYATSVRDANYALGEATKSW